MDKSAKTEIENATPRRRNLRPAIFLTAVILVAAGVVAVIMLNKKKDEPKTANSPSSNVENVVTTPGKTTEDPKTDEKPKEEPEKSPEEEKPGDNLESDDGKTPIQQDSYDGNPDVLTGVINYADSDGETLMIRVAIDQYLESGECLLELNSSNDSFSITDQIAPSASTSSCSYDISTSLLNEGKYNIKITLKSGGKTGTIEGEVNV